MQLDLQQGPDLIDSRPFPAPAHRPNLLTISSDLALLFVCLASTCQKQSDWIRLAWVPGFPWSCLVLEPTWT